jgi:hypothetical protein
MKILPLAIASTLALAPLAATAQQAPARWQRRDGPTKVPLAAFHSTQSANLPTAETLRKGELLVEISHRFYPAVSEGSSALWGFDGPVTNRLGLAWAPLDHLTVGVLRSNLDDNLELDAKARLLSLGTPSLPLLVGVMAGLAFNTQTPDSPGFADNESQSYAQLILNTRMGRRLAVGVVPTFVHNPRIADSEAEDAFVLGVNGTLYFSSMAGVFGEWIASEARADYDNAAVTLHDVVSLGIQLETGGHFFKVLVTNSTRLNPTQVLPGTPYDFSPHEWRVGFNLTRVLALGS